MVDTAETHYASAVAVESLTTPAGLQANATLRRRREIVLTLNVVTWLALLAWAASILEAGGWTALDGLLLIAVIIATPWPVLGFWNAVIGLWLRHGRQDGINAAAPFLNGGKSALPVTTSIAVLMTQRNEDPARAIARLRVVKASLDATGHGAVFSYFILSDTNRPDVAAREERAVGRWRASDKDRARIVYRRRASNAGFKAGNLRDFCKTHGRDFELMLPLDADSLMTGDAILELARIMQTHPEIGILQSLVVGSPSRSAFARIFQFGMRHGMRAYTMGQAWWVGDCGPFWGHNALVRIKPYLQACELPLLAGKPPLGGPVLSHDQVEATLMRRAGYEVRVMPVENGSFEDNPPDALEFVRRDVRWCQGNMQYLKLLGMPGLMRIGRFQLLWAVLMFVGVPAWTLMIGALPFLALDAQAIPEFPAASAKALYAAFLLMYLAPKLAGLIDAMLTPGEVNRFGGPLRFTASAAIEIVFSFLQGAVSTIHTSIFMVGLLFGRSIVWSGQQRDARGVSWRSASEALWPQLLFGTVVCGALLAISPAVLLWSLPLTAGYLLAIPFTVLTADPRAGAFLARHGLAAIPEDFAPPPEIVAVQAAQRDPAISPALAGVFRSLRLYLGPDAPRRDMDALYARFSKPGDLVFDIGAHVGDRVSSFRRLGARVVALEPQPLAYRILRLIHGRDADTTLLEVAAAPESGRATLRVNTANPTVSTMSPAFVAAAAGQPGWEGQHWDAKVVVPARSLNTLVAEYGEPAFIKIDVEGFEDEVLKGLRTPVAALSFEFTTISRDVAARCVARIAALGDYGFDIALGESQKFTFGRWVSAVEMTAHLRDLPHAANSGDVYALRLHAGKTMP